MNTVQITEISIDELRRLFRGVIQDENIELRKEIVLLRQDLARSRGVITLKQATPYFDEYVKPETILSYVHYEGLPAVKRGRLWFVYFQDLLDWQIGLIGHASTKNQGIKRVIPPRHRRNALVVSNAEQTRLPQQNRDEPDLTTASKKPSENRHLIRHPEK